ncbi:MAG: SCP2 sterol-binding domain-containing protein [Oscillospiraceae bacterium]|nr:SCP2 sterol-binding domain-containing protein [Oscillospiraceae bacterium]
MNEKVVSIVEDLRARVTENAFDPTGKPFLAIQITLKDLDGCFYVELKDDKLSIEPAEYNDRQANIIMTSDNFMKMINGNLKPLIALTTGKLKIEGDLSKAKALGDLFGKNK